jgi:hypothetical protein
MWTLINENVRIETEINCWHSETHWPADDWGSVHSGAETYGYSFQPISLSVLGDHTQKAVIVLWLIGPYHKVIERERSQSEDLTFIRLKIKLLSDP